MLARRETARAGLVSPAGRAHMKAPVPRPALRLVDKTSRSCSRTPEKAAGQRAAEPSKRPAARFPIPARSLIQTGMEGEPFGGGLFAPIILRQRRAGPSTAAGERRRSSCRCLACLALLFSLKPTSQ